MKNIYISSTSRIKSRINMYGNDIEDIFINKRIVKYIFRCSIRELLLIIKENKIFADSNHPIVSVTIQKKFKTLFITIFLDLGYNICRYNY